MTSSNLRFDDLQEASDLVSRIWEAGTLFCLRDRTARYAEVGRWLATWSGSRPSDSAVTRALKRLQRAGFVAQSDGSRERRRGMYTITAAGRQRVDRITSLIGTLNAQGQ